MPEGSIVLLRASLRGAGRQAECDVLVRKIANRPNAVSSVGAPAYAACTLLSAPTDLPDGEYRVSFEGHFVMAAKEHGVWLARARAGVSRHRRIIKALASRHPDLSIVNAQQQCPSAWTPDH